MQNPSHGYEKICLNLIVLRNLPQLCCKLWPNQWCVKWPRKSHSNRCLGSMDVQSVLPVKNRWQTSCGYQNFSWYHIHKAVIFYFLQDIFVHLWKNGLWTRLRVSDSTSASLLSNTVFFVYYPNAEYIFSSAIKAAHKQYILQVREPFFIFNCSCFFFRTVK